MKQPITTLPPLPPHGTANTPDISLHQNYHSPLIDKGQWWSPSHPPPQQWPLQPYPPVHPHTHHPIQLPIPIVCLSNGIVPHIRTLDPPNSTLEITLTGQKLTTLTDVLNITLLQPYQLPTNSRTPALLLTCYLVCTIMNNSASNDDMTNDNGNATINQLMLFLAFISSHTTLIDCCFCFFYCQVRG